MKIEEQPDKLTIECGLWPELNRSLGYLVPYSIAAVMLIVAVIRVSKIAGILVFFLALLGMWIVPMLQGAEAAFHCLLDRDRRAAIVTYRAPWFFWQPEKEKVPFEKITAVIFSKTEKGQPKVSLARKSDDPILFAGEATVVTAERLSRFLQIPLQIELAGEHIIQIPWNANQTANFAPTPCASCGAPLPLLEPGMKNIRCRHCGMSMVVQWKEDEFSYEQATESEM